MRIVDVRDAILRAIAAEPGDVSGVALHPSAADDIMLEAWGNTLREGDNLRGGSILNVMGFPVTLRRDLRVDEVVVLRLPTEPRIENGVAYFGDGMTCFSLG